MSSAPLLPARLDWPSAIGLFLINYGTLDYSAFVFLKDYLPGDEFARVKERSFKDRVEKIGQLLKDAKYPPDEQIGFARLLKRLQPIRELRNHIAHGHMYLTFDANPERRKLTLFQAKDVDTGLLPESKHVEFPELLAALSTLNELIEEFQSLTGFRAAGCATTSKDARE